MLAGLDEIPNDSLKEKGFVLSHGFRFPSWSPGSVALGSVRPGRASWQEFSALPWPGSHERTNL